MENIKTITNEILDLRGAKVSIFGQQVELDKEVSPYLIDVVDILNILKEYEVDYLVSEYDEETDEYIESYIQNTEGYIDYLLESGAKESRRDNSYNWNSNISNDIDFTIYELNGEYFVDLKVHKFGDVRTNYTDNAILKFSRENEFIQVLFDCYKNENVTVGDASYNLEINPLSEGIEVYDIEKDEDVGTIYGCYANVDEVIEDIKSLVS